MSTEKPKKAILKSRKTVKPLPSKTKSKKKPVQVALEESAQNKKNVLMAFLKRVPAEGWTDDALTNATTDCGLDPEMAWALFPGKAADALETWSRFLDQQMTDKLKTLGLGDMKVRMRIFWGVKTRLSLLEPHKEAAGKALRFLMHPKHAKLATKMTYETVNHIWVMAGDQSTDYNFYTKRFLLAGVYTATFVYWLKDTSPEHFATTKFLEERIENVLALGKIKQFPQALSMVDGIAGSWIKKIWPSSN